MSKKKPKLNSNQPPRAHPTLYPPAEEWEIISLPQWPFSVQNGLGAVVKWKASTSLLDKAGVFVVFVCENGAPKYQVRTTADKTDEEIRRMADATMLLLNMKDGVM